MVNDGSEKRTSRTMKEKNLERIAEVGGGASRGKAEYQEDPQGQMREGLDFQQ